MHGAVPDGPGGRDVYMYADETGNLDFSGAPEASSYFGIGTSTYFGPHQEAIGEGLALRFDLERQGLNLPRGFHAVNDTRHTRTDVFTAIKGQAPRFDTTFLRKSKAYSSVVKKGPTYIYKLAWYLHFKEISWRVTKPGDRLWVVAATLQTNKRKDAVREALHDVVCEQGPVDRDITLCIWDSPTSWGLQVADYALWAVQRKVEKGSCQWWDSIEPTLATTFFPWGK